MIYLDAAAILPTTEDVRHRMSNMLENVWGNVSGGHSISREAKDVLELAREKVANNFGVNPDNIVFTSGATEALNLATQGYIRGNPKSTIFSSSIEHEGVNKTVHFLEAKGEQVIYIPVDKTGKLELSVLDDVKENDLVCVMAVNNEIGVVNDITAVSEIVQSKGAKFLVDAVQSFYTSLPTQITSISDYSIFSGHKLGAPQGVGVLVIKDRSSISPLSYGGAQEWELRPGTTPAYLCDAFAYVWERELNLRDQAIESVKKCRAAFVECLKSNVKDFSIHGEGNIASDHIVSVHFDGVESQMLLTMLDSKGICVSKGSACASGASKPSHVLLALGMAEEDTQSTIRFSFSRHTDIEDVMSAADIVAKCVTQLREYSQA